uniref:Uncharacterized protein n=1 Tax=Arundo donax TaxID=35708 RepID=A0A0A9FDP6_ARUDO
MILSICWFGLALELCDTSKISFDLTYSTLA